MANAVTTPRTPLPNTERPHTRRWPADDVLDVTRRLRAHGATDAQAGDILDVFALQDPPIRRIAAYLARIPDEEISSWVTDADVWLGTLRKYNGDRAPGGGCR